MCGDASDWGPGLDDAINTAAPIALELGIDGNHHTESDAQAVAQAAGVSEVDADTAILAAAAYQDAQGAAQLDGVPEVMEGVTYADVAHASEVLIEADGDGGDGGGCG